MTQVISNTESVRPKSSRTPEDLAYPQNDLSDCVEVVRLIHSKYGMTCGPTEAGVAIGHAVGTGAYEHRIKSAHLFGLLHYGTGGIAISAEGVAIRETTDQAKNYAVAFLRVPLFRTVFNRLRGKPFPDKSCLSDVLRHLGLAEPKHKRAMTVFINSARQASFVDKHGMLLSPVEICVATPSTRLPLPAAATAPARELDLPPVPQPVTTIQEEPLPLDDPEEVPEPPEHVALAEPLVQKMATQADLTGAAAAAPSNLMAFLLQLPPAGTPMDTDEGHALGSMFCSYLKLTYRFPGRLDVVQHRRGEGA